MAVSRQGLSHSVEQVNLEDVNGASGNKIDKKKDNFNGALCRK